MYEVNALTEIAVAFRVYRNDVGTRLGEILYVGKGIGHHQVNVKYHARKGAQCLYHGVAEGEIGNEMTVHNVDVKHFGAHRFNLPDFFPHSGEISRKQ